jgi:hypothetical protein
MSAFGGKADIGRGPSTEKEPGREVSSRPGRSCHDHFCAGREGGETFRPLCAVVLEQATCALGLCGCGIML